jgi:N-acetylglucosamine malate deacetylase 1
MPGSLLVIAPHPDDEVLGCGGVLHQASRAGARTGVLTVAAHRPPLFTDAVHATTIREANAAHALLGVTWSRFLDHPAVFLDRAPTHEVNQQVLDAVREFEPDVVLIPFPDRHVDHRRLFDAALVATRPVGPGRAVQMVAAYETLSETHWNAPHIEPGFVPNWVADISPSVDTKLEAMACFKSQVHAFPAPRSLEALKALALFRGSQAGFGFGEAFHVVRCTVPPFRLGA